jgi:hypothetical protein
MTMIRARIIKGSFDVPKSPAAIAAQQELHRRAGGLGTRSSQFEFVRRAHVGEVIELGSIEAERFCRLGLVVPADVLPPTRIVQSDALCVCLVIGGS